MEPWRAAAEKFIDTCTFKHDIACVFLTGSRAVGNGDEFSDIDVFIVLNDDVTYRERGSKRIDGLLVEYFANPVRQVKKGIEECLLNVDTIDINMILSGIVIFNKNNVADDMIAFCKEKLAAGYPEMKKFDERMGLYLLWDEYDELSRAYAHQRPDLTMHFHNFIQHAFEQYSRYICSPVPGYQKLYRWLSDDTYRKNYGLAPYKDPQFIEYMRNVFLCKDAKEIFDLASNIYHYVTDKMGGIDIDHFVMRGPCS